MKFAIVGATGGSGLCIVRQALDGGHEVTAIVRNKAKLEDIQHDSFKVVEGDVFSAESLQPHFEGCDAVFSCLGSQSLIYSTTIYSAPMRAIVTAMRGAQVKRILMMSSWYVKVDPDDDPGYMARWVVRSMLSKPLADLTVMEQFLEDEGQDIDYTIVKPPHLIDGPSTGQEIVVEIGRQFCDTQIRKMSRADVARFMLANVKTEEHFKKALAIGIKS
ncbi:uncharacterized protein ycf39 [Strongylocentrotus purpuratus]|uniref:NAD(P)-binding domain-containing protein n=1 Tax=Strongylocentrotus purpuratus TaxID=7668 RepID=A0A7M7PI51_STRPU|nr:uncharacterized protein ycf39 [Strongylocentrotus purpuratus]|eukprot:XP_783855.3 PREDICTED: uncharacterized protein ycf39 [Strongylocentrotus purpuratus]